VVDHENFYRTFGGFQSQAELFLNVTLLRHCNLRGDSEWLDYTVTLHHLHHRDPNGRLGVRTFLPLFDWRLRGNQRGTFKFTRQF